MDQATWIRELLTLVGQTAIVILFFPQFIEDSWLAIAFVLLLAIPLQACDMISMRYPCHRCPSLLIVSTD
jgi:hypothetical protein